MFITNKNLQKLIREKQEEHAEHRFYAQKARLDLLCRSLDQTTLEDLEAKGTRWYSTNLDEAVYSELERRKKLDKEVEESLNRVLAKKKDKK